MTTNLIEKFNDYLNKNADPRTEGWFLMHSPIPTIIITVIYLILVKILLPSYMKDRKPYELKKFVLFYNFVQVLLSITIVYGYMVGGWIKPRFNNGCFEPTANKQLFGVSYLYFLAKLSDLTDTIIFCLRKKDKQITNLHVYHHSIMPLSSWFAFKYVEASTMTFLGLANSFIHVVMYTYYLLSALGPKVQKYLWWKKYVTLLQLIQFILCLLNSIQGYRHDCLPKVLSVWNISQSIIFFLLFSDFYVAAYKKKIV